MAGAAAASAACSSSSSCASTCTYTDEEHFHADDSRSEARERDGLLRGQQRSDGQLPHEEDLWAFAAREACD